VIRPRSTLPPNGLRAPTQLPLPADCWVVCAGNPGGPGVFICSARRGAAEDFDLIGRSADVSGIAGELQAMSSVPLAVPDDPDFAIARGAALDAATGPLSYPVGDATMSAPVAPTGQLSPRAGDPTMASPAAPTTEAFTGAEDATRAAAAESGPQLAYSMEDSDSELLPMEYGDDEDEEL